MATNAIQREQTLFEHVSSINEHMEELAAAGEWEQVSDLLGKRNAMLREIGDDKKAAALKAASRSTDLIRAMAQKAQSEIAGKLAQLQRGREATDSYRAHS